jgi:hypothetical protein
VTHPDRENPPRPLPIHVPPDPGDSVTTYIRRLARANHLRPAYLRHYLNRIPSDRHTLRFDWLAALADTPVVHLRQALSHPPPDYPDRPTLFAAIRADARANTRPSPRSPNATAPRTTSSDSS